MPDQPLPVSRRHWLRISVRGLIILVLIVGGWLGWMVRAARVQREVVAAIRRVGGTVAYDRDGPPFSLSLEPKRWPPGWLVQLIGVDFFDPVVHVALTGEDSAAAAPRITDLTQITTLFLVSSSISDGDLAYIEGLNHLQLLSLDDSTVTDAGMEHLKGLSRLTTLSFERTRITDSGLARLQPLNGLRKLSLADTKVSDEGLAHLGKFPRLEELNLSGSRVSDAGLAHLAGLTYLEDLDLRGTGVSDSGLAHLCGLRNLGHLYLAGTRVSDTGVHDIQDALPALEIHR